MQYVDLQGEAMLCNFSHASKIKYCLKSDMTTFIIPKGLSFLYHNALILIGNLLYIIFLLVSIIKFQKLKIRKLF